MVAATRTYHTSHGSVLLWLVVICLVFPCSFSAQVDVDPAVSKEMAKEGNTDVWFNNYFKT